MLFIIMKKLAMLMRCDNNCLFSSYPNLKFCLIIVSGVLIQNIKVFVSFLVVFEPILQENQDHVPIFVYLQEDEIFISYIEDGVEEIVKASIFQL